MFIIFAIVLLLVIRANAYYHKEITYKDISTKPISAETRLLNQLSSSSIYYTNNNNNNNNNKTTTKTVIINDNCYYSENTTILVFSCHGHHHTISNMYASSADLNNICVIRPVIDATMYYYLGSTTSINNYLYAITEFTNRVLFQSNIDFQIQMSEPLIVEYTSDGTIYDALDYINSLDVDSSCGIVLLSIRSYDPIVGMAYIGGACNPLYNGFVVSTSVEYPYVFAHELGHLFNASHVTTCSGDIMNPYVNVYNNLYICTANSINMFVDLYAYQCLSNGTNYTLTYTNDDNTGISLIILLIVIVVPIFILILILTSFYIFHYYKHIYSISSKLEST